MIAAIVVVFVVSAIIFPLLGFIIRNYTTKQSTSTESFVSEFSITDTNSSMSIEANPGPPNMRQQAPSDDTQHDRRTTIVN
jgi:hypothetical protein